MILRPHPWQPQGTPAAARPLTTLQGRAIGQQYAILGALIAACDYLQVRIVLRGPR